MSAPCVGCLDEPAQVVATCECKCHNPLKPPAQDWVVTRGEVLEAERILRKLAGPKGDSPDDLPGRVLLSVADWLGSIKF